MGNYPPGTSASDSRAPWNQPPSPECHYCDETIASGGDHEPGCRDEGLGPNEILHQREEDAKIEQAERQMDEQRIQATLKNS